MIDSEVLYEAGVSIRKLPVNLNEADLALFKHELRKEIPATFLLYFNEVDIYPDGIIAQGSHILPEAFVSPEHLTSKARLKFLLQRHFAKPTHTIKARSFWITDNWSIGYFHWMTDTLPRLLAIREKIKDGILLLPGGYQEKEYVISSLSPFVCQEVMFVNNAVHCQILQMPTHTAPTGNYKQKAIQELRNIYVDYYQFAENERASDKIYISRGKAQKRKIINENDCLAILNNYGFKTVYFEDLSYAQQVEMASHARYVISNHGAGLTNILFMRPEGCVLELRKKGDAHNNCYFTLADASNLKYFYQLCDTEDPREKGNTANLWVDCRLLKENIENMLAY